jgi:hypothetical protein
MKDPTLQDAGSKSENHQEYLSPRSTKYFAEAGKSRSSDLDFAGLTPVQTKKSAADTVPHSSIATKR